MTRRVLLVLTTLAVVWGTVLATAATHPTATRTGIAALEPALEVLAGLPAPQRPTAIAAHV